MVIPVLAGKSALGAGFPGYVVLLGSQLLPPFGFGLHHCVGFQLARAEMFSAFTAFLSAFGAFELAVDPGELRYGASIGIRCLRTLPLRLHAAVSA